MKNEELPIPPHFKPNKVSKVWRVDYQKTAENAIEWSEKHNIRPAADDRLRLCLIAVDVQNTFCIPNFELFVAGRSGVGAVSDNKRLCRFIYRNLDRITQILPTMDTHQAMQIFHSIFLVNKNGDHPTPFTLISNQDIVEGVWRFNPDLSPSLHKSAEYVQRHLLHYTDELKKSGKYELTIWPYHAMLGGIGHALVSSVEEAIFFHTIARCSQSHIHVKGDNPLTEHYSVLGPEVMTGPDGDSLGIRSESLFKKAAKSEDIYEELRDFDAIVIAGQAKSHCVAWTIADLLSTVMKYKKTLVEKIYLLEDCTSPVVIPGVIDYAEEANRAFRRFEDAGMHVVKSTDPIDSWQGIKGFSYK